jgi:hypothetical protein
LTIVLFQKADRRDVESRVLKKDFNATCGELSQNINDCMQKFHIHVYNKTYFCLENWKLFILG